MSDQRGVKLPFVEISQCFVTSLILPWKYLSTVVSNTTAETAKKQCSLYTLQLCFMAKTAGFIIWAILTTIFRRIIVAISVLVCAKQYQTQPVQWLCYWYGWGPTSETDRFPQKLWNSCPLSKTDGKLFAAVKNVVWNVCMKCIWLIAVSVLVCDGIFF